MPVRFVFLSVALLALAVSGCGPASSSKARLAGEKTGAGADDSAASDTDDAVASDEMSDDDRLLAEMDETPLPDDAPALIALVQEINAKRKAEAEENAGAYLRRESPMVILRLLEAGKKLREMASATPDVAKLPGYDEAMGIWLLYRAVYAGADEIPAVLADAKEILANAGAPTMESAQAAVLITDYIADKDKDQAIAACHDFIPILNKSDNPEIRSYATRLEGVSRGLDMVGHELEIKGTTIDGKPFDLKELRGKVVLVDFWATWCHWCIEELPRIKQKYKHFHDQGFEVVSISVDDDRDDLDSFLKEEKPPWITLYDGPWSKNPNAIYYGIAGLPQFILVDKEGKVVSAGWEGKKSRAALAELLGPDDSPDAESDSDKDQPASDADKPATDGDKPPADADKPASDSEKPAAEGDKSAGDDDKAAAGDDEPAAKSGETFTETRQVY